MSYIHATKVEAAAEESVTVPEDGEHRWTDGEELDAAAAIVRLVSALDNGEALIITRELF